MRHKPNPVIAKRIAIRNRTALVKGLAAKGMPPDQIAKKTGQSVEWIKLTLEDFDPKKVARNNERRKVKAQQTDEERRSRIGRPPKVDNKKTPDIEPTPIEDAPVRMEKPEEIESTPNKGTLTVKEVLARYKQIREDYKAGKWSSIKEAAECEGLDPTFVTYLIKGKTSVD